MSEIFSGLNADVSVVIPTLGGESLAGTIEWLNRGTLVPSEILICIPKEYASRVQNLNFPNVKIVKTSCRGQVAQRATGFQEAKESLVLQLDDDILVRKKCLQYMAESLVGMDDVAVGPKLYDIDTGTYHSFLAPVTGSQSWYEKIFFKVINGFEGYQPGQIGRAGINMGLPEKPDDWQDLGWLSGGCMLHRKENLVLHNYYPFKGKAYAEDLFHSVLLKNKGVRLNRCGAAICDVDFSSSSAGSYANFLKIYFAYSRTMFRFVALNEASRLRLFIFLHLNLVRLLCRRLLKKFLGEYSG